MYRMLGVLILMTWLGVDHASAQVDASDLRDFRVRSIGPAGMSGRVTALAADIHDPNIIFVGAASGGLWKSVDGGLTWDSLFDEQPVASIGSIAIHPKVSDVIWIGTGEGFPRNSVSVGNGVFRSLDGGMTWNFLGLEGTERIPRVIVHPDDPNTAWVAALGTTWGESSNRGVYKTVDGGRTWQKILYVNETTGAADMVIDPQNPSKIFVAMWDHRRWPWSFRSGGPGSGLYLTLDGGETWEKLSPKQGLPGGELGRIGLAISPSNPSRVYALVEAKKNVLLRSDDGGRRFQTINSDSGVSGRPFYYSTIRVDPENPNRLYKMGTVSDVSDDGGRTFQTLTPYNLVHPDHHALWIHPGDGNLLIDGNDGGVAISRDRGKTWRFVRNLPLAQYYHIQVDQERPYNVYGGMQDNGSWRGPNTVWENGGIRNHHWDEVGFGDGFNTIPDPEDAMTGYAMSQEGYLSRWNLRSGERRGIRPLSPDPDVKLRFNWDAPLALDPFDPATLYFGSQFVHKSTDRGASWTAISGDLTTNNPNWQKQAESGGLTYDVTGAENHTNLVEIAPSPVDRKVIWAGSDDGRVHVTRNGGESWESVENHIFEVPKNTWVAHIEASKFDAGTAFVMFDDHRRANWTPYVMKTQDYGKTWVNLANQEIWGYALSLEQDPVKESLLFLGTEFGLYVTVDGGEKWMKWPKGYPTASTIALVVHPRDHDLVIGTHGRAAFVIDDISPLREWDGEAKKKPLHLFPIAEAQQHRFAQTGASRFAGNTEYRGQTRSYGAMIHFSVADTAEPGSAEIAIHDEDGALIRIVKNVSVDSGINRYMWNLRRNALDYDPEDENSSGGFGPEVFPGTYQVTLKYGDHEQVQSCRVVENPHESVPVADRQANLEMQKKVMKIVTAVQEASSTMRGIESEVTRVLGLVTEAKERLEEEDSAEEGAVTEKVSDGFETESGDQDAGAGSGEEASDVAIEEEKGPYDELEEKAKALKDAIKKLQDHLSPDMSDKQGIVRRQGLRSSMNNVRFSLMSLSIKPTPNHRAAMDRMREDVMSFLDEVNEMLEKELKEFRECVAQSELLLVTPRERIEIDD